MQIRKINNNKLKVILNSNDLSEKKIDIDSFLSTSIQSQDLFFEILDLAEEKYNFDIENNKAMVETISLDNNIFILTITKIKSDFCNTYDTNLKVYCFEKIDDILNFYSFIAKTSITFNNFNIYKFLNKYYLVIKENSIILENILSEYSIPLNSSDFFENILIEYGKIVK